MTEERRAVSCPNASPGWRCPGSAPGSAARIGGHASGAVTLSGWRARPAPRGAFPGAARSASAYAGRRAARETREVLNGRDPQTRPGAAGWWRSSGSGWRTRSTARTSRSVETSPRPRATRRRRRRRWGPGCWRSSSSWCAAPPSSRSSRASGWACESLLPNHVFALL